MFSLEERDVLRLDTGEVEWGGNVDGLAIFKDVDDFWSWYDYYISRVALEKS